MVEEDAMVGALRSSWHTNNATVELKLERRNSSNYRQN